MKEYRIETLLILSCYSRSGKFPMDNSGANISSKCAQEFPWLCFSLFFSFSLCVYILPPLCLSPIFIAGRIFFNKICNINGRTCNLLVIYTRGKLIVAGKVKKNKKICRQMHKRNWRVFFSWIGGDESTNSLLEGSLLFAGLCCQLYERWEYTRKKKKINHEWNA